MPKEYKSKDYIKSVFSRCGLIVSADDAYCIDVGNPHLVCYLPFTAKEISERVSPYFPDGINVEVVKPVGDELIVSVYERGSGYTYSCGSGSVAVAYCEMQRKGRGKIFNVRMQGGSQRVEFSKDKAILSGEVKEVFSGEINV